MCCYLISMKAKIHQLQMEALVVFQTILWRKGMELCHDARQLYKQELSPSSYREVEDMRGIYT